MQNTKNPFQKVKMASEENESVKLHGKVQRSERNKWAESIEEQILALSPLPMTYDVSSTQPPFFKEFAYTEIAGGFWVYPQSVQANIQFLENCVVTHKVNDPSKILDNFKEIINDKYELETPPEGTVFPERVAFLPGDKFLDMISQEQIQRILFNEPDVMFKPHPLTTPVGMDLITKRLGANRVLSKDVSGFAYMKNAKVVYTTTANEFAISATALGKQIVNIGNPFKERQSAYYPVSNPLFFFHFRNGVETAQQVLASLMDCPYSGLLFPWQEDYLDRAKNYFKESIKFRARYSDQEAEQVKKDQ